MQLTTENTAIVLDSTSDYPEAPSRFPNMRFVPLYVRFGDETHRDYVELGPAEFFEKLRTSPVLPATSQPTPQDFVAATRARGLRAHLLAARLGEALRHVPERGARRCGDRWRPCPRRRLEERVARDRDARARDPAAAHARHDRRGDRKLVERFYRDCGVVFTLETLEFLQRGGRIGRAAALAGSLLNVRPILAIQEGEVVPVARVRGRQKALVEFERRFEEATEDKPGLRIAVAHADAPEWVGILSELVWRVRPKAEIEFTSTLGAVVSTHAGPGTVGFFWFQDDA